MKNFSKAISKYLLILFPPIFFFSYFPIISLGSNNYMNFELSLPEIWLVLFFLFSLPQLKTVYKFYTPKILILAVVLPLYFSLTIIWSENRPRAVLTAGLFWLLVFAVLNLIYYLKTDKTKKLHAYLIKALLISATAVSAFCWIQCILDVASVPRGATLLCRGCVSTAFGFPHPSGFAIEPQFMGNLLLAPVLLCFYLLSKFQKTPKNIKRRLHLILLTLFLTSTLFLTLSRGAIYAFIVALFIMLVLIHKKSMLVRSIAYACISLVVALVAFGTFSALGPTSDSFLDGTTKAIHQLSLGKIDLRSDRVKNASAPTTESTDNTASVAASNTTNNAAISTETDAASDSSASFSGYVEESTNTRLSLNSLAIKTWLTSPKYILIGTGLGSAGPAMHRAFPSEIGPKEIVQNEYVSLLLETGLIGTILFITVVFFTTFILVKPQKTAKKTVFVTPLFISVVLGFALTLLFFSGLPNALHLYLFPFLFLNYNFRSKDDFLITEKV